MAQDTNNPPKTSEPRDGEKEAANTTQWSDEIDGAKDYTTKDTWSISKEELYSRLPPKIDYAALPTRKTPREGSFSKVKKKLHQSFTRSSSASQASPNPSTASSFRLLSSSINRRPSEPKQGILRAGATPLSDHHQQGTPQTLGSFQSSPISFNSPPPQPPPFQGFSPLVQSRPENLNLSPSPYNFPSPYSHIHQSTGGFTPQTPNYGTNSSFPLAQQYSPSPFVARQAGIPSLVKPQGLGIDTCIAAPKGGRQRSLPARTFSDGNEQNFAPSTRQASQPDRRFVPFGEEHLTSDFDLLQSNNLIRNPESLGRLKDLFTEEDVDIDKGRIKKIPWRPKFEDPCQAAHPEQVRKNLTRRAFFEDDKKAYQSLRDSGGGRNRRSPDRVEVSVETDFSSAAEGTLNRSKENLGLVGSPQALSRPLTICDETEDIGSEEQDFVTRNKLTVCDTTEDIESDEQDSVTQDIDKDQVITDLLGELNCLYNSERHLSDTGSAEGIFSSAGRSSFHSSHGSVDRPRPLNVTSPLKKSSAISQNVKALVSDQTLGIPPIDEQRTSRSTNNYHQHSGQDREQHQKGSKLGQLIPARLPTTSPSLIWKAQSGTVESLSPLAHNNINSSDMDFLSPQTMSSTRLRAIQDARAMQKSVVDIANKENISPPPYVLEELSGKGTFGRVYRGKEMTTGRVVAIKIIDVEKGDSSGGRGADTYADFMKEVGSLKLLSESKARNINHVIDAFPMGPAMWMITEYCGGGSVATLMRPLQQSSQKGLKEVYIIPIIREVAIAIQAVHKAGIIHRDIKCANILVTEDGGVQLCDFGVAGITAGGIDKRNTFIGTPNWMAPEIWDGYYSKEVDVWALGALLFEMATGLPPNAGMRVAAIGTYLRGNLPRLEGETFSTGLRDMVARCLVENPSARPTIVELQQHAYIKDSEISHPTSALIDLVKAFRAWEASGGTRRSLFNPGGAAGIQDSSEMTVNSEEEWNFSTTDEFDESVREAFGEQDIINVYGGSVDFNLDWENTSKPSLSSSAKPSERGTGRRRPPNAVAPMKAPIEKLFDPNTVTSYQQNSVSHYGGHGQQQPIVQAPIQPKSDLALRDNTAQLPMRESVIDLGDHDAETGISTFHNLDTIKPLNRGMDGSNGNGSDFTRPAMSDPADTNKRATQEWRFPSMPSQAPAVVPDAMPADPKAWRFPMVQPPAVTPGGGGRPTLRHHPTEPVAIPTQGLTTLSLSRPSSPAGSRSSLIDLDFGMPDELERPSTADSTLSSDLPSAHPFHWEGHSSLLPEPRQERIPSLFLADGAALSPPNGPHGMQLAADVSDFSASEVETETEYTSEDGESVFTEGQHAYQHMNTMASSLDSLPRVLGPGMIDFAQMTAPPSQAFILGQTSVAEDKAEFTRMWDALAVDFGAFAHNYSTMVPNPSRRSTGGGRRGDDESGSGSNNSNTTD